MLKALVGSVLFLSSAGIAIARPPIEVHRDVRPTHILDRGAERAFDRARPVDAGARQREARGAQGQFDRLTPAQKEMLCAVAGVCIRSIHSDDVEDKTK